MRRGLAALLLAAGLAACQRAPEAPAPPARPLVVATFYPLHDFTRHVAGELAEAVSLVPPGVEPHDWEPTPQDAARVQRARALVHLGTGLDAAARRLAPDGSAGPALIHAAEGLDLLASPGGAPDPHVWLDPVLARQMVDTIRAGLARADPPNAAAYARNAGAYGERLAALHEAFEAGLRECAQRRLVVSHAAFGYLARRYRLTQISAMGTAPEAEPSPAAIAEVVRVVRRERVRVVFFEPLASARVAETIAREVGARVLPLNPVEGLTREEAAAGADYLRLMRDNLARLREGLECR